MLKFDIIPEDEKSTYVQYDIYESNSKIFLNLEECRGENIMIDIPINLDSKIELLYDMLNKSGYNLFDENNPFYNDICATYTTPNGTDILLYDRRMDLFYSTINISLCQKECFFISYDLESKKAKCNCPTENKKTNIDLSEIEFDKNEMKDKFKEPIKNSNFKVLKCYKLLFIFKIFKTNTGSIIMTILFFIYILLLIISIIIIPKKINLYIRIILKIIYTNYGNIIRFPNNLKKNKEIKVNSKDILKDSDKSKSGGDFNIYGVKSIKIKKKKKKKKMKGRKNSKSDNQINNIEKCIENKINKNINNEELINFPPKRKKIKKHVSKKTLKTSLEYNNISNILKNNKNNQASINHNIFNHNKLDNNDNIINNNNNCNGDIDGNNKKDQFNINQINLNVNIYNHNINKGIENKNNFDKTSESNLEIFTKSNYGLKKKHKTKKMKNNKIDKINNKKKSKKNVNFSIEKTKLKKKSTIDSGYFNEQNSEKRFSGMKSKSKIEEILELNDEEMNSLIYQQAIELDKRTYFQYYISLVKKKQLILFTFLPANDYNIVTIKILLFIISFSLYFTINGFFFSDDTMHKIYVDNGNYNIIYQIPQILYSSVIPSLINLILKSLALSEKSLITIKQEKEMKRATERSEKVKKFIYIKFLLFFIFSLILMLFFWYFISCFCAVYNNTQSIFFKDTIISLSLSMLYPFVISLIPGFLRLQSLRSEKKDKQLLYSFSQFLAVL